MTDPTPTSADHLAWAICASVRPERDDDGERPCRVPCAVCRAGAAAALHATADQVVPERLGLMHPVARDEVHAIRADILAIAAELEGHHG